MERPAGILKPGPEKPQPMDKPAGIETEPEILQPMEKPTCIPGGLKKNKKKKTVGFVLPTAEEPQPEEEVKTNVFMTVDSVDDEE